MSTNKILTWLFIFWLTLQSVTASYTEVDCSTDSAFSDNSCDQCFDWWEKWQWESFWMFTDIFSNKTTNSKVIYKEEQTMPTMVNLGWDQTSWSQVPSSDNFWQYTPEFEALYSTWTEAYVVGSWTDVVRLTSSTWSAYKLDKDTASEWQDIWLLVFSSISHDLVNGNPAIDTTEHKECVLYKSGVPTTTDTTTESTPVKKLPKTWPEQIILLFVALLAWLGFTLIRKKAS